MEEEKCIENSVYSGMTCKCGFKFAGPGELRNAPAYQDENHQWWVICPGCGKEYKSD